jgi:predicted GIY-YIG superfamily endonuclease
VNDSKRRDEWAVYVVAPKEGKPIKIGCTSDISNRLSGLQTSHWQKLFMFRVWWCPEMGKGFRLEKIIHRRLKDKRLQGEWFDCHAFEVLAMISDIVEEMGMTGETNNPVKIAQALILLRKEESDLDGNVIEY